MEVRGVRPRGNSIQIEFTYQGIRCRETMKLPPTKENLRLAVRKKQAVQYEIELGVFDYLKHFPGSKHARRLCGKVAAHTTIEQALKEWLRRMDQRCERATIRDYGSSIYHHLIPSFGKLTLDQLKTSDVRDWIDSQTISAKRINNVLIPLRQMMKEAYCDEIIDKNPLDRIRNLPPKKKEPEPFTAAEIEAILAQLDGQARNFVQFAFWTGLRTSELIGLRWDNADIENQQIYVCEAVVRGHRKGPKTSSGRRSVALTVPAYEALFAQKEITLGRSDLVFTDPADLSLPLDDQKIRKRIWTPALKAAGVKYRSPYKTRHTFASMMLSSGAHPMKVSMEMGHSDWGEIRRIYGRWIPTEQKVNGMKSGRNACAPDEEYDSTYKMAGYSF